MSVGLMLPPLAFHLMWTVVSVTASPPTESVMQVPAASLKEVEVILADAGVTAAFPVVPVHVVLNFDVVVRVPTPGVNVNGGEILPLPLPGAPQVTLPAALKTGGFPALATPPPTASRPLTPIAAAVAATTIRFIISDSPRFVVASGSSRGGPALRSAPRTPPPRAPGGRLALSSPDRPRPLSRKPRPAALSSRERSRSSIGNRRNRSNTRRRLVRAGSARCRPAQSSRRRG